MISRCDFNTDGWYEAKVPSTVLATLVEAGEYPDPYFGMNLQHIPEERFASSWWYRTDFDSSDTDLDGVTLLRFDGINYTANLWLNGRKFADDREVHGAFRRYCFDVSEWVRSGTNVLAVEVTGPKPGNFSTGFVDWNPPAPDRNMGIFRPVTLHQCQNVSIDNPFVQTDVDTDTLDRARLTISAQLTNHSGKSVTGVLVGRIESIAVETSVTLGGGEQKTIAFFPETYPDLHIHRPRLWWSHDLGEPNLYELQLEFVADDEALDSCHTTFGIRKIEDYFNNEGQRGFRVNGKDVLIKGGGWSDDLLLTDTPKKLEAQIQYVKHMNLNCIRLEGIWGKDPTLYDLCDRYGILIMVGWSCHWEHAQYLGKPVDERFGGVTSPEDIDLIATSWQDQVIWLRNHPSIFVWTVGSDKVAHPDLERRYIETFRRHDPTRPYLASTGGIGSEQAIIGSEVVVSDLSGSTGVKMLGPYAYTPPVYWYEDRTRGGSYGFNTETGPGAQPPILQSLKKMIPTAHLWPIDTYWDFHCGLNEFARLDRYCQALEHRYGPVGNVEQFAYRAQVMNYELIRPMLEAFRVNKGRATGVIQWMLNAAWPKLYWQLYDWYLHPTGAFYGTKKACEPLQLIYNYADRNVFLVNDTLTSREDLRAEIQITDLYAKEMFQDQIPVGAKPQSSQKIFTLPEFTDISLTYFLILRLFTQDGERIAANFYWLSTKEDLLDYKAKVEPWAYYTPSRQYADFTLLNTLPATTIEVQQELIIKDDHHILSVALKNTGKSTAFAVELNVVDNDTGDAVVPIFWQDNYITLLPNESNAVKAVFAKDIRDIRLDIQGWNLEII